MVCTVRTLNPANELRMFTSPRTRSPLILWMGERLWSRLHGIRLFWRQLQSSARTGKSAVRDTQFIGRTSTRISAQKDFYVEHQQRPKQSRLGSKLPSKTMEPTQKNA